MPSIWPLCYIMFSDLRVRKKQMCCVCTRSILVLSIVTYVPGPSKSRPNLAPEYLSHSNQWEHICWSMTNWLRLQASQQFPILWGERRIRNEDPGRLSIHSTTGTKVLGSPGFSRGSVPLPPSCSSLLWCTDLTKPPSPIFMPGVYTGTRICRELVPWLGTW